jgi:hypothetical protein
LLLLTVRLQGVVLPLGLLSVVLLPTHCDVRLRCRRE